MKAEHARELWRLRFLRVLELEQEAFEFYEKLLKEKGPLLETMGVKKTLQNILHDEGKHIGLAKKLLRLATLETKVPGHRPGTS